MAYEISVLFMISSEFPRPREVERDHNRRRKHVDIDGYFTSLMLYNAVLRKFTAGFYVYID